MQKFIPGWLLGTALSIMVTAEAPASPGSDALHWFFNETKTFKARFGQVVLDESLTEISDGHGTVWVQRPGLFRWDYEPPEAQQIIGDGDNVWIYDIELEQITVQNQDQALGGSPAILLSGSGDIEDAHVIEDIGTQGRFDWINLIPRDQESEFREVRIGFEDNRLRLLELLDNLGQRTRISFVDLKENTPIPPTTFDFIPPEGVDIIDNTR